MPYPHEHSCRIKDPGGFTEFRRGSRQHEGKSYGVIYGKPKGNSGWEEQAFRYPKGAWTAEEARSHCGSHDGRFEAASGKDEEPVVEKTEPVETVPAEEDLVVLDFEALLAPGPDEIRVDPDELKTIFQEAVADAAEHAVAERIRQLTGRLD